MTSTEQGKPIFGTSTKRFGKLTVHPAIDPSGLYTDRPKACDPCLYHPQAIHQIFEVNKRRKINKDPWRYKKEIEEWALNLGYRNQSILAKRRWQSSILGPAWIEVKEPSRFEPACKNVGFGRTPRTKPSKGSVPGPGAYYKANPYRAPYGPHSSRPTFEREDPCRFKNINPNWSLAPNRYSIIDKENIDQKSNKLVSTRGPYDLFTGERDGSSIKNHFNTSLKCSASTWPIVLKGSFETYKKSQFGVMNKTNRQYPHRGRNALVDVAMCVKCAEDPGPASLNLSQPKVFKQNKKGFNSSYDKPPGYQRIIVWPGVGRYNVKTLNCGIPGNGHRHVFLSKEARTIGAMLPKPMNTF